MVAIYDYNAPFMPKSNSAATDTFAIVDDHRAVADIVGYALQTKSKARCIAKFYNLKEAEETLPALAPRVVIIDWRVGQETSAQLIQSLKARTTISWLLFTAWPTAHVFKEAIPAGIQGCVSKSADYEELARALTELLNGGSYFCKESMESLGQGMALNNRANSLNEVEREILRCIAAGLETKEMAFRTGISVKTVHNYLTIIRKKLNLFSLVDLANFAVKQGIAAGL